MLTDLEIRRAKPGPKPYHLTDTRGLFLWVSTTGAKSWRYKYRFEGIGKQISYGQYPDVLLSDARDRHSAARRLLAADIDPMVARKTERQAAAIVEVHSFQSVAELWLTHWAHGKSPRHVDTTRRRLEHNVFPHLGARPIGAIRAPELVAVVKMIEARGAGDLAKRSLETMGQIFRYGMLTLTVTATRQRISSPETCSSPQ